MSVAMKLKILSVLILASCCATADASGARDQAPRTFSAAELYGHANALAADKKFGLAILNYERAALLAPGDAGIQANLAQVRASAGIPAPTRSGFENALRRISPDLLYTLGILGLVAAGCGLLLIRFDSRRRRVGWIGAAAGSVLLAASACDAVAVWPVLHEAVVLQKTAARISPIPAADASFELAEGQTVQVGSDHEGFDLVKTDAGQIGWVPRDVTAAVIPVAAR